ncbi:Histidine kinase-, DNA gyrase B-, and HSP90-like ATPase [compost metagenome]
MGIRVELRGEWTAIVIADRGKGLDSTPEAKGAGLGLSIVDLLLKRMELAWEAESSPQGTSVMIYQPQARNLNKI